MRAQEIVDDSFNSSSLLRRSRGAVFVFKPSHAARRAAASGLE